MILHSHQVVMLRSCCLFVPCFFLAQVIGLNYGPKHPPTKGGVWPKPFEQITNETVFMFDSEKFEYEIVEHSCKKLQSAISRCKESIHSIESITKKLKKHLAHSQSATIQKLLTVNPLKSNIHNLKIELTEPCEEYPHMNMDESYTLHVKLRSKLKSNSIWGIIRGLETFSQLFYLSPDYKNVFINATQIVDFPQYPHRGLLLDTSRHYFSVDIILRILEAMAINKMNVFHWHIVDDPSFPYQSERYPELSAKGAFCPFMIYTKSDILEIIQYAAARGIRVIPEIDGPAHVNSWQPSHPEIMTKCRGRPPLNPVIIETYDFLRDLYKKVQDWFPDNHFHLGGDEVDTGCWKIDPDIRAFMKTHKITDTKVLHQLFVNRTIPLLKNGSVPIVWEEVYFEAKATLPPNAIVQLWGWDLKNKIHKLLANNHKVLISSYWYLDYKISENKFDKFYTRDPRVMTSEWMNYKTLQNIVGGEACMWGEMADDNNVMPRVWPRTSAVAEVLWSYTNGTVPAEAYNRIEEHTCRMIRRGIPAEPPEGAGFCITVDKILITSAVLGSTAAKPEYPMAYSSGLTAPVSYSTYTATMNSPNSHITPPAAPAPTPTPHHTPMPPHTPTLPHITLWQPHTPMPPQYGYWGPRPQWPDYPVRARAVHYSQGLL